MDKLVIVTAKATSDDVNPKACFERSFAESKQMEMMVSLRLFTSKTRHNFFTFVLKSKCVEKCAVRLQNSNAAWFSGVNSSISRYCHSSSRSNPYRPLHLLRRTFLLVPALLSIHPFHSRAHAHAHPLALEIVHALPISHCLSLVPQAPKFDDKEAKIVVSQSL